MVAHVFGVSTYGRFRSLIWHRTEASGARRHRTACSQRWRARGSSHPRSSGSTWNTRADHLWRAEPFGDRRRLVRGDGRGRRDAAASRVSRSYRRVQGAGRLLEGHLSLVEMIGSSRYALKSCSSNGRSCTRQSGKPLHRAASSETPAKVASLSWAGRCLAMPQWPLHSVAEVRVANVCLSVRPLRRFQAGTADGRGRRNCRLPKLR